MPSDHLSAVAACGGNTTSSVLQVVPGGRVIWRSAALTPPYAKIIAAAGFTVRLLPFTHLFRVPVIEVQEYNFPAAHLHISTLR